jgi:hypothetical protein
LERGSVRPTGATYVPNANGFFFLGIWFLSVGSGWEFSIKKKKENTSPGCVGDGEN